MGKRLLSFVIPCYNSEKTIFDVIRELASETEKRADKFDYEIILVNDCSPDNVSERIQKLCDENHKIRGIIFSKNFGQHSALMSGYSNSNGEIIITLDDDGQAPIESIYALVDKIDEGYDVVFGKYSSIKQSAFRKFGSKVNDLMSVVMIGKPKNIVCTSFFAMKKFVAKQMIGYKNPYPYIGGLIFQATSNVANIEVNQRSRIDGSSGYSFFKLLKLWLNGFTAFSVKPLRIATVMGFISALLGAVLGIVLIIRKLFNPNILMGYSSTMAVLLFTGGMIMLMLGMIGEYIGRIYICINNSPQYVIRDTINIKNSEEKHEEN